MSTVLSLIKFLAACIPFALLLLLVSKCNLKRVNRGRQFMMPIAAAVYCIALALVAYFINRKLSVTIENIQMGLMDFLTDSGLEQRAEVLLEKLSFNKDTGSYLLGKLAVPENIMQTAVNLLLKYLLFFLNTASVLAFLAIKGICLPIANKLWKNKSLMESTCGLFYEYDEENQVWLLQERMRDMKKLLRAFYIASAVIAVALMVCSQQFYDWSPMQSVLFPSFAVLILGECVFFLSGYTKSEYEEDILGDDSISRRMTNLARLRRPLKELFGDRLLLEGTELESAGRGGVTDLLENMAVSDDPADRIAAEYFSILQSEGAELQVDSIISAGSLLKGKSVLFCDPFYKDMTGYLLLPMTNVLMNRRKCLVIAGRKSTEPQIKSWLEDAVRTYLKMNGLWRVAPVSDTAGEYEIGILSFSQLYDLDMLCQRREFFHEVGFVLILEPSLILATGQVGLSLVVNYCDEDGVKPNYCICDRNCDGLVDTMSHMIKRSITIVSATEMPTCLHSEMCWQSDGEYLHRRILPDISRYLGVGTELAAVMVREQAPRVVWRSENKFPVVDMKWFAGQYYGPICQYANLPVNQASVYNSISFEPDLWGAEKENTGCLIVEDEFCNLLEMVQLFLTRTREQAFINVISEDYLLRGYMQDNYRIFSADKKAVPSIVPDYARTERNAAFRLMMLLIMNESIPQELAEKELRLVGVKSDDVCGALNDLIRKYTMETRPVVLPVMRDSMTGLELESGTESHLHIREQDKPSFLENIGHSFRTAYYITEDDRENSSFMDAKLFGHIYQAILPGQFFTYDGKYYEVCSVTPEKGVLVRRAADHIVNRRYYRQKRSYHIESMYEDTGRTRVVNGLEISMCQCDINVETGGYLELSASGDLKTAREVLIGDTSGERFDQTRAYRYKNVLKVRLPGASEEVRYTICLLLMEIFRTVYAEDWHYLAAVTPQTEKTRDALRGVLYTVDMLFNSEAAGEDCIYIIEDSDVDMGLLDSVDRNLKRLFGVLTDYLDWHTEMMNTPDPPETEPESPELPPEEKRGLLWHIKRFFGKIKGFFKRDKNKPDKPKKERKKKKKSKNAEAEAMPEIMEAAAGGENPAPPESEASEVKTSENETPEPQPAVGESAEGDAADEAEAVDETENEIPETAAEEAAPETENPAPAAENGPEPEESTAPACAGVSAVSEPVPEAYGDPETAETETADNSDPVMPGSGEAPAEENRGNRYSRSCYLCYGDGKIDGCVAVEETLDMLNEMGFGANELHAARKGSERGAVSGVQHVEQICDFCGLPLSGVSFDMLDDGRVRCVGCSASAISSMDEFRALYKRTVPSMEGLYDIRLNVPIHVRMTDARTIAKHTKAVFKPTSGFDSRVVGFARRDKDGYSLYIENGAPRLRAMSTIVHELTHIWQYTNWDDGAIKKAYGKRENRDMVYEGMAMWAEIQFMYLIGESQFAKRMEENTLQRGDVYGEGFKYYCAKYPLLKTSALPARTPFHSELPL